MNTLSAQTAYVGSTEIKQVRLGSELVLAPNGNELWYKSNELPSLDLRFAEDKSLVDATTGSNLIDFTRASSGTYVGSDGLIKTAVTNLLLRSEEFDNATRWFSGNSTVSSNAAVSPAGAATADLFIPNNSVGAGSASLIQDTSVSAEATYTWSVYAKSAGHASIRFEMGVRTSVFLGTISTTFNFVTGTLGSPVTFGTPPTGVVFSRQALPNGWYRLIVTGTTPVTTTVIRCGLYNNVTGDGTSGIYLWGAQLEQSDTVGEYVKTTSTINSAPRFDHDPTTGESLGLLVEESRTNLLLQSEDFSTTWGLANMLAFGSGSTANAVIAPDGTLTADHLVEDTSTGGHNIGQSITVNSGSTYVISVYAKAPPQARRLQVLAANTNFGSTPNAVFDISAGSVASSANGTASITAIGNSWYRCHFVTNPAISTGGNGFNLRFENGSTNNYTGDGTSGIYLWGAQLEAGAFPTSYIPTEGSTATRAADVASITGSNFSSWYRQDEGAVFNDSTVIAPDVQTQAVWSFTGGTYFTSLRQPQAAGDRFRAQIGNTFTPSSGTGNPLSTGTKKACVAYSGTAGRLQVGSSSDDVTAGGVSDATDFYIGSLAGGIALNGTIRRLTYWPTRLGNDTLQTITQ